MADEIWIKHNLGTFQQPYIFQQNRNKQSPSIGQAVAQQPAIARQPSTYQKQSPYSFRAPVSYQEPNIRNAQQPNIRDKQSPYIANAQNPFIRNAQTAFTYNHRSPGTYRVPVDYQTPFTYQFRSPGTYRSPVGYQLPFTYQHQSPGTYRYPASAQSPFTYQASTPVIYSYRSPYIFNMWGSPGSITTNASRILNNPTVYNENANDAIVATTLNIRHIVSTKTIQFYFIMTGDGGFATTYTTNQATVTYSGTLNNLEARFAMNNINVELDYDHGLYARLYQAFDTNGQIDATDVGGSTAGSVSGSTSVNDLSSNEGQGQTFQTAWGNLGVDNNIDKSAMLYVACEGDNDDYYGAYASVGTNSSTGSSLSVQLRANQDNNDIVTLYQKVGVFSMDAVSFDDDDTS